MLSLLPTPFWDTSIYRTGTVGIEPTHLLLALRKEFSDLAIVPKQAATLTVFQSRFMFQRFRRAKTSHKRSSTDLARIERATALNI
ncbi:TPA: hypothetical protein VO233_001817 [Streptococcus pyogenes]|nr:hypothetical protein [Streptococcus pyogenes]